MYFSIFALIGLITIPETGKIFIRALAKDDKPSATALLWSRFVVSVLIFITTSGFFLVSQAFAAPFIPPAVLGITALCVLIYPFDLYLAKWQSQKNFGAYCTAESIKYVGVLGIFIALTAMGHSITISLVAQLGLIAVFHIISFSLFARHAFDFGSIGTNTAALFKVEEAIEARRFSYAGILPASLEHIDKLLVGWVFGLEFLGIYTLAYSTGRTIYNMLKPGFYIYYRQFVDTMPGLSMLRVIGGVFTLVGVICSILFWFLSVSGGAMQKFQPGAAATIILFASYGIAMVRAVYGQAYILNVRSDALHLLKATTLASFASLLLLALALVSSPAWALILLALQYPLRDGLTLKLLANHHGTAA
ncbi:hypothetical protein [Parasphingorhabdus halotolerans]|uniref:Membrane protein involved in the export of O-antigen and teichoic acid n=1 Tax=Parasphingorhabdus halotolerans TaxID=2725558 RepID=A0A6H2DND2_9SPHN|nr:hypothetical protein [Parasphingorhabdus halotolerans]QJB69698.1 hypothetical protein HF685_10755 [Parasphingorhabdus halotolerans]